MKRTTRGAIGLAGFSLVTSLVVGLVGNPFGGGPFGASGSSNGAHSIPTGGSFYLDAPANTVSITYDGGTVGVNGAPLEVPEGINDLTTLVQEAVLAEDLSLNSLVLTKNESGADTLVILGGRLRLAPFEVNGNAWIDFDVSSGIRFGQQMNNCAGCALLTDVILPRQNGVPVTVGDADGVAIACQSSPGTCDAAHKGAAVCVTETASSATKICRCIRTSSSGDYRFLNTDNSTRGSTTTDCPDTTP